MKEVKLPSGAKLSVNEAPFADAKNLFQAVFAELKPTKIDPKAEIDVNFFKDMAFILLSSKAIEDSLWPCLNRCLYNGLKITQDMYDTDQKARGDFLEVCILVAKENIAPFVKSLYAEYAPLLGLPADALK